MLNYYERYQPDVVLAYNDLAKEAEAFGCRVKYSDYVVPSIDQHVLQDDKAGWRGSRFPIPYTPARLPAFLEQCEAPGRRPGSRRRSAPSRSVRGRSRC